MKINSIIPGAILHDAIVGTFKSRGTTLVEWCREAGVSPTAARQAAYGQCQGVRGQQLLNMMMEAAGREVVELSYSTRMLMEAEKLKAA